MGNWEAAVMAMIGISAIGFLLADGEAARLRWVQAMRRCLMRLSDVIRYEQPGLCALLGGIDLRTTRQERELSLLLRRCAAELSQADAPPLLSVYAGQSARSAAYGVLGREDCAPFEQVLGELGQCALTEQLRMIEEADERLRVREEALRRDGKQRAQLMRTLSLCAGAAVFLVMI